MPSFSIPALAWHVRQKVHAISWAGILSLALFAAGAAAFILILRPQQQHISAMQQALTQHASPAESPGTPEQNPAQQLAAFYQFFPKQESVPDKMARLYQAAAQNGLNLEQGEYHMVHAEYSQLSHYEMVFPVKGEYPKIRQFVAQAQADLPSLALDSISFSRQKISDPKLETQIKFSLYWSAQ